jgi:hypothetical protein
MASTTTTRLTPSADEHFGTFPIAANTRILKGIIVQLNGSDQAVPGADGNGFPAVGRSQACYDNTTGSEAGGTAGDLDCEVDYGVFGWAGEAGHLPTVGKPCYVADNQTVSSDSDSDQRGIAGYCVEVRNGLYWVDMNPATAGQIVIAATEAAQLDTAQTDIDALEADVVSTDNQFEIPLGSFRLSTGASIAAFADNSADGFELYGSEALGLRWNDDGTAVFVANVMLPSDLDPTADIVLSFLGCRVGSEDTTAALTVGIFFHPTGAAADADADAGGDTTAFDGATTVLTEETLTIAAADVPAASTAMTITVTPTAALDADDMILFGVRANYTGVALT